MRGGGSEAARIHRDAFVSDGHNDLALRILDGEDPAGRLPDGHLDLPRLTGALAERGHPEETLPGVLGENFRRLFAELLP